MAILPPWHHTIDDAPFESTLATKEFAIGGKLLQSEIQLSATDEMMFQTNDEYKRTIKQKMAYELARAMIECNLIEFTQVADAQTFGRTVYARCYLAPNEQVKILRTHYGKI